MRSLIFKTILVFTAFCIISCTKETTYVGLSIHNGTERTIYIEMITDENAAQNKSGDVVYPGSLWLISKFSIPNETYTNKSYRFNATDFINGTNPYIRIRSVNESGLPGDELRTWRFADRDTDTRTPFRGECMGFPEGMYHSNNVTGDNYISFTFVINEDDLLPQEQP
jgi:hypothetical protein